jgi:hypothetical protein
MYKTWASGAIELLKHAGKHINLKTAFDKRIAFISIDNSVEIIIKTYLSLPRKFFEIEKPSKKELDDCNTSFTCFLSLLFKYEDNRLLGIVPGDIEHYHRIRNTLYHDGTGLAVDQEYIYAYIILAKLLLKRLFNVDFLEQQDDTSLEKLILDWNYIEEALTELFETGQVRSGSKKWIDAISMGLLSKELVSRIISLRSQRNKIVHSKIINNKDLAEANKESKVILEVLNKLIKHSRKTLDYRNFFFEPSISEIKGKLTTNSFYGPPNYGDTPKEDRIENVWMVYLENPINIHQLKEHLEEGDFNSTQFNITRIQLVILNDKLELKKLMSENVRIKGSFFGANTGHHFTPILMSVISIIKI